ncbi:tubulin glycylase 3B-like [Teleopsis dalmanni]|uniref:tubulin glycylase 3B-like n=1 Tax=Teleopsis dalmanni TaxID=139649 RepID=UPI0018CDCCB4|nr:tubulin glycylase 3B-like [Teleopsis dalmanni]
MDEYIEELCALYSVSKLKILQDLLLISNSDNCNLKLTPKIEDFSKDVKTRIITAIYKIISEEKFTNKKIFIVYGNYEPIREALFARGWIEKLPSHRQSDLQAQVLESVITHANKGNLYESVALSKVLEEYPANFIWQYECMPDVNNGIVPYRNRIRHINNQNFTRKTGLLNCFEQNLWYKQEGLSNMICPRAYRLNDGNPGELTAFINDYRQTQCRNLIKFLWDKLKNPKLVFDENKGTVPKNILKHAVNCLQNQAKKKFLDDNISVGEDPIWVNFIKMSDNIIHKKAKLKITYEKLYELTENGMQFLHKITNKHKDYDWDGLCNIWILKPSCQSCGAGIVVSRSLYQIVKTTQRNPNKSYIIQKYLEHPLLIHDTKFDIRVYMLLTIDECFLSIWIYKDCYLRFSSTKYTLQNLEEQVHLTNHSVQKKYPISTKRTALLPENNMWSLAEFQSYLKSNNLGDKWVSKIYPEMKENLTALIMSGSQQMKYKKGSFHLYGCDFMLSNNFDTIFIEINNSPDLSSSTTTTKIVCSNVMQDLVRVVVDLPEDAQAPTGDFELVHKIKYQPYNKNLRQGIVITGEILPLTPLKSKPNLDLNIKRK